MFNNSSFLDDSQHEIKVDSSVIGQIDQRLGETFLTREAFIDAALQYYISHLDESARTQTIHGTRHALGAS